LSSATGPSLGGGGAAGGFAAAGAAGLAGAAVGAAGFSEGTLGGAGGCFSEGSLAIRLSVKPAARAQQPRIVNRIF
jgi:hypothetical protein